MSDSACVYTTGVMVCMCESPGVCIVSDSGRVHMWV